jgi:hypothetical protein
MVVCQSTTEIFIVIFMTIVLCGCKEDAKAPDYDNFRADMTLQTVEQINNGQTEQAIITLKEFRQKAPEDPFPIAASRIEEIRLDTEKANKLLRVGNINELGLLLQMIESEGNASPEILAFRAAPPALEALARYCARMPWERSSDIIDGFELLRPHSNILKSSAAFNAFMVFQQSKFETMKHDEELNDIHDMLNSLDRATIGGDAKSVQAAIDALRNKYPHNAFFSCQSFKSSAEIAALNVNLKDIPHGREALEIAAALRWDELPPSARRGIAEFVSQTPRTFCGAWLAAMTGSRTASIDFFNRLKNSSPLLYPNRKIIASLLKLNAAPLVKGDWSRRSPCPGVPEMVAQILSVGLHNTTNNKQKENE